MIKKIGITGGIGSGKSIVCTVLEKIGFPVFYSDKVAKESWIHNESIRKSLEDLLGTELFQNNQLNKAFMAGKIFSDPELLQQVNALIHPHVRALFDDWASHQNSPIVFNEAAILFETGAYTSYDATILVTAPQEIKIARVMKRDQVTKEEVLRRMDNQWPDEKKIPLANYVIVNDDTHGVVSQIETILAALLPN